MKEIEEKEIEGYIRRTKFTAPYERAECDTAFYSKLEGQKRANDRINQLAEKKEGKIYTDKENLMRITTDFYKNLYTSEKVQKESQEKLLKNVKNKLSKEDKTTLDKAFTEEEVMNAINNLPKGKSPGLDGFPVDFYAEYWYTIKSLFMSYI